MTRPLTVRIVLMRDTVLFAFDARIHFWLATSCTPFALALCSVSALCSYTWMDGWCGPGVKVNPIHTNATHTQAIRSEFPRNKIRFELFAIASAENSFRSINKEAKRKITEMKKKTQQFKTKVLLQCSALCTVYITSIGRAFEFSIRFISSGGIRSLSHTVCDVRCVWIANYNFQSIQMVYA